MSEPFRRGTVQCGTSGAPRRMAYLDWGERTGKTLICVHGLTRCARDFDCLAPEMGRGGYRVICRDVAGRGESDWLKNPVEYVVPTYVSDMMALIARHHVLHRIFQPIRIPATRNVGADHPVTAA